MDFTVVKGTDDSDNPIVSVTNSTDGLCAVRVTKMSDGSTQYQSYTALDIPSNKTTAFTFTIVAGANYMVEAWYYNSSSDKLVPAVVRYI